VLLGALSRLLTFKLRACFVVSAVLAITLYAGLSVVLFVRFRYWLPWFCRWSGALFMTHVCMITYRFRFEQKDKRRIRPFFPKLFTKVFPNCSKPKMSPWAARGARSPFTSDIRGFTRMTDEIQAQPITISASTKLSRRWPRRIWTNTPRPVATVSLY